MGNVVPTRKVRDVGSSLMVAIPAQLAALIGPEAGDQSEFDHIGDGTLRLKKA